MKILQRHINSSQAGMGRNGTEWDGFLGVYHRNASHQQVWLERLHSPKSLEWRKMAQYGIENENQTSTTPPSARSSAASATRTSFQTPEAACPPQPS